MDLMKTVIITLKLRSLSWDNILSIIIKMGMKRTRVLHPLLLHSQSNFVYHLIC